AEASNLGGKNPNRFMSSLGKTDTVDCGSSAAEGLIANPKYPLRQSTAEEHSAAEAIAAEAIAAEAIAAECPSCSGPLKYVEDLDRSLKYLCPSCGLYFTQVKEPGSQSGIPIMNSIIVIGRIVKRKDGWHVLSEKGKNLGGPYKSRGRAKKRLNQVEYFKHRKGSIIISPTGQNYRIAHINYISGTAELIKF